MWSDINQHKQSTLDIIRCQYDVLELMKLQTVISYIILSLVTISSYILDFNKKLLHALLSTTAAIMTMRQIKYVNGAQS